MGSSLNLIWEYFYKRPWTVIAYLVLMLFNYPLEIIGIAKVNTALTQLLTNGATSVNAFEVLKLVGILIGLYLLVEISVVLKDKLDTYHIPVFEHEIRMNIIDRLFNKNEREFDQPKTGALMQNMMRLPGSLSEIFERLNRYLIPLMVMIISFVGYFFYLNRSIGLITAGVLTIYLLIFYRNAKRQVDLSEQRERQETEMLDEVEDVTGNLFTVFSNNRKNSERGHLDQISQTYTKTFQKELANSHENKTVSGASNIAIFAIISLVSLAAYQNGSLQQTTLASILTTLIFFTRQLRGLSQRVEEGFTMLGTLADSDRYLQELDIGLKAAPPLGEGVASLATPFNNLQPKVAKPTRGQLEGGARVEFQNVDFKYPKTGQSILNNFNLTVSNKDSVCLIGHSGSGKSTVVKLLTGFLKSDGGIITLDGVDINSISREELRSKVKYLNQQPRLFNRSILDNLVYGTQASSQKVLQTIRELGLEKIFEGRDLTQPAGKHGDSLSGGQRQVVALLRCYLEHAPVVILDEPTVGVDGENKKTVLKLIQLLKKRSTVIAISHDPELINLFKNQIKLKRS